MKYEKKMKIDVLQGWHRYTELMHAQTTPNTKAMLDNMRHHLKYELLCDPKLFETMIPEPEYKFYSSFSGGILKGRPAVEGFYHDMWDSESSLVELTVDLCSADDWGVACEGAWIQQCPGESLVSQGRDVDKDAWYLASSRIAWFFPYEEIDGKMRLIGEIIYGDDEGMTFTKIAKDDVLTIEEAKASFAALDADELGQVN